MDFSSRTEGGEHANRVNHPHVSRLRYTEDQSLKLTFPDRAPPSCLLYPVMKLEVLSITPWECNASDLKKQSSGTKNHVLLNITEYFHVDDLSQGSKSTDFSAKKVRKQVARTTSTCSLLLLLLNESDSTSKEISRSCKGRLLSSVLIAVKGWGP